VAPRELVTKPATLIWHDGQGAWSRPGSVIETTKVWEYAR
jgi:hypothetical protein